MRLAPVPYLGQTLCERSCQGLEVNLSSYPPGRQPLHVHDRPSLSMLVAGRGLDRSRNDAYEQPPLTVVFHPTVEPHANEVGPDGVLGFTVRIEPTWLEAHDLTERDLGGYRVLPPSVAVRLACLRLLGAALRPGPYAEADLDLVALELLEPLVQSAAVAAPRAARPWLHRAEDYLHAHFRSAISLRSVAREAGLHPVYLARVFRRRHGCSVGAYIRALRLLDAGESILLRHASLAEVAYTAGFADQAHLARTFTHVVGFSPKTLRRVRTLTPG